MEGDISPYHSELQTLIQQQQLLHQHHCSPPPQLPNITAAAIDPSDRFPQWSVHETKEFLIIRAELDQNFMEMKRNKVLWEAVARKMKAKGFNRSAEQCKCKWKNLLTRYKGSETIEQKPMRQQFPFYNELQAIFTARVKRMLWAETDKKAASRLLPSDNEDDNEESEELFATTNPRKRTKKGNGSVMTHAGRMSSHFVRGNSNNSVKEVLEEFTKQMVEVEREWREALTERERERCIREREWRKKMEEVKKERVEMEKKWVEREEERRAREEARAQKTDALINLLLNQLITRDQGCS